MPFTIPNLPASPTTMQAAQSAVDSVDFDIINGAEVLTGVVSGCAVTWSSSMTLAVAAGTVRSTGTPLTYAGGTIIIGLADGTNPRFSLVVITSAGTLAERVGTAAANPVFPTLTAGDVALASVYTTAGAGVLSAATIVDKRMVIAAESGALTLTQPATGTITEKLIAIAGSTVNTLEIDASAITNGLKWVWDKFHHMTATQAAVPTQSLGAGAGTTPTNTGCIADSTDQYGTVQWTQGTGAPAASSIIMTVSFRNAYVTKPSSVVLTSKSGNTNNGLLAVGTITVNGFDILNGATQATVASGTAAVTYRVN